MRKKFLSAFLLGALALGATSTIVSCKDYDGDISELRTDINGLDATLKSELQSIKDQLSAQKSELETKIASAQATLQAAIDQKADKTTVADLAATVTNLQTALSAVDTRLGVVERAIEDIKTTLDGKADKSEVEALKIEIAALQAALTGEGGTLKQALDELKDVDTQLAADIVAEANARALAIIGLEDADKEIIEDLKEVSDKLTEFMKTQDEFNEAVMTEISNITEYITNLPLQLQILNDAKEDFETRIKALETILANDYPTVKANLETAMLDIDDLKTKVGDCIDKIGKNAVNIEANAQGINALGIRVTNEVNTLNDTINTKIAEAKKAISADINVVQNLLTKRLTSILFAPSTYVDGVEAINFASLAYKVWGDNLLANEAPAGAAENRIDDGTTTAVYYLNPSGVDESSIEGGIKGLSFISNTASNITRGAAEPVLTVKDGTIENGKLTLKLSKNNVALENSNKNFTIVSLKAPLAEKVLSEEEKNAGGVNVYSDWARLTETTSTPLIYNKKNVVDGVAVGETEADNRFYNFGKIYTQYNPLKENSNEALHFPNYGAYTRDQLNKECCAYNETLDLKELVTVCDEDGNEIDAEAFGLKFKFNLPQCYNVLNAGSTTDATNQQDFASISEDGIMSAKTTASDEANRAAIGKTPVVQVVLYDANNENAVVDVRYILVKWTEKATESIVCETVEFEDGVWGCGDVYTCTIGEGVLNKIASKLNLESAKELSGLYTVDYKLTDAYEGDEINTIGTVEKKNNGQITGQADNIVATFDAIALDKNLYEGGKAEVTGYVTLTNKYDNQKVIIPVYLEVEFDSSRQLKASEEYVKDMDLWADGGASIVVKPTREDDVEGGNSSSIKYRLLDAYLKGGAVAKKAGNLIAYNEEKDEVTAKLAIDPASLKAGWTLNETGTQIKIGKEIAATFNYNTGLVQLREVDGVPTAAALKLVGETIRVKLVGTICDYSVVIDEFNVTFGEPLSLAWNSKEVELKAGREVSEDVDWTKMLTLKEVYGEKRLVIGTKDNKPVWNENLIAWYVTGAPVVNTSKATVNDVAIEKWTDKNNNRLYNLEFSDNEDGDGGTFTFTNNGSLDKALTITVPVTVRSKWQTWTETITISVPKAE